MPKQTLSSWLYGARWDKRQRAKRYTQDHVIGEGWREDLGEVVENVVNDAGNIEQVKKRQYRYIPGIKRETAIASIDPNDVANNEWPIDFSPSYENKSWRTRLGKWVSPATPMISNIKANDKKGLMLVTFGSNGAQVVYDHVPREVIAQLQVMANSGGSLGKTFWDLVRYRGSKEGSKYSYWYSSGGVSTSSKTQEEKDWLDKNVFKVLRAYDEGTTARKNMSAAEYEHFIQPLSKAYDDEDYDKMERIYNSLVNNGYWG